MWFANVNIDESENLKPARKCLSALLGQFAAHRPLYVFFNLKLGFICKCCVSSSLNRNSVINAVIKMARCYVIRDDLNFIGAVMFSPLRDDKKYFTIVDFREHREVAAAIKKCGKFNPYWRLPRRRRKKSLLLTLPGQAEDNLCFIFGRVTLGEYIQAD